MIAPPPKTGGTKPALWVRVMQPKILLPLMIFLAVLMVGVRVNDMWVTATTGKSFQAVPPAVAEVKTAEATPKPSAEPAAPPAPAPAATPKPEPKPRAAERDDDKTQGEEVDTTLLKQLSERRLQLDARSTSLDQREAMIKVAETRVDQKIREMETLRTQLQGMVNQANTEQAAQIDNLVKIYEAMKPTEAARIFETLELPTLMGVIEKMKPARTAAVMAAMPPEKAKEITVALTKKDQLPQIK